jgi:hypothetical protein
MSILPSSLATALALVTLGLVAGPAGAQTPPLTAAFEYSPAQPDPGQAVTVMVTTTGGSGAAIQHDWDLDGDGAFDDARGTKAQTSFAATGSYVVRLRAQQTGTAVVDSLTREVRPSAAPPAFVRA